MLRSIAQHKWRWKLPLCWWHTAALQLSGGEGSWDHPRFSFRILQKWSIESASFPQAKDPGTIKAWHASHDWKAFGIYNYMWADKIFKWFEIYQLVFNDKMHAVPGLHPERALLSNPNRLELPFFGGFTWSQPVEKRVHEGEKRWQIWRDYPLSQS